MTIKKIMVVIICFFGLILSGFASSSGVLNIVPDAETTSVAGSYNYITGNIWNVYYNQAGLSKISDVVASASYKRVMNLFNYANLAAGFPLVKGFGAVGISFLDYGNTPLVTTFDGSTGLPVEGNTFYAYDFLVSVGYAYSLKNLGLNVGAGVKFLQNDIANNRVFYSAADLSIMESFLGDLSFGLNVRNIGVGINTVSDLPLNGSFGFSLPSKFLYKSGNDSTKFILGGQVNFNIVPSAINTVYGMASIKILFKNIFHINSGVVLGRNDVFIRFSSIGAGYSPMKNISVDYAYSQDADNIGFNHTLTLTYYPFNSISPKLKKTSEKSLTSPDTKKTTSLKEEQKVIKENQNEDWGD